MAALWKALSGLKLRCNCNALSAGVNRIHHSMILRLKHDMLIGFKVGLGQSLNHDFVQMVQPIFLNASGREVDGEVHGRNGDREVKVLKARPGYAVGAITIRTGLGVEGFSATFMKVEDRYAQYRQVQRIRLGRWTGQRNRNSSRCNRCDLHWRCRQGQPQRRTLRVGPTSCVRHNCYARRSQATATSQRQHVHECHAACQRGVWRRMGCRKVAGTKKGFGEKASVPRRDECKDDLASKYVLLKLAKDIASQAGDGSSAFGLLIEKMAGGL